MHTLTHFYRTLVRMARNDMDLKFTSHWYLFCLWTKVTNGKARFDGGLFSLTLGRERDTDVGKCGII